MGGYQPSNGPSQPHLARLQGSSPAHKFRYLEHQALFFLVLAAADFTTQLPTDPDAASNTQVVKRFGDSVLSTHLALALPLPPLMLPRWTT